MPSHISLQNEENNLPNKKILNLLSLFIFFAYI